MIVMQNIDDLLGNRHIDPVLAGNSNYYSSCTPHVCRVMSMVSCTVRPEPMFSPKVRLRESGDWHVATRSPTPAKPWNVSGSAPNALESRHFGQAAGDQ